MLIAVIYLIGGFYLLIKGADYFVDGSSKLALKFNLPEIVVGLTIVAFGTSAPEAAVSITSTLGGSADLAVANVVGSNILNILLILGVSGLFAKLTVNKETYQYELPFVMFITAILVGLGYKGYLNIYDGIILWFFFIVFLGYLYFLSKKGGSTPIAEIEKEQADSNLKLFIYILGGMFVIIVGSNLAVRGASNIASFLGISKRVIGLTIVALGTSLPELITSVTAVMKGNNDLGVGNIVGSNIFNILFVLGTTALIAPGGVAYQAKFIIDGFIALGTTLLFFVLVSKHRSLNKFGAIILLVAMVAYLIYLI